MITFTFLIIQKNHTIVNQYILQNMKLSFVTFSQIQALHPIYFSARILYVQKI